MFYAFFFAVASAASLNKKPAIVSQSRVFCEIVVTSF